MRETIDLAAAYRAALDEFLRTPEQAEPRFPPAGEHTAADLSVDDLLGAHAEVLAQLTEAVPASEVPALILRANHALALALARTGTATAAEPFAQLPIHALVERQIAHAGKVGGQFCLIVADVDRFRSYNTAFGWRAGDEALIALLKCIESACRAGDIVARCGGDEFCVLIPGGSLRTGLILAERVRIAVQRADLVHGQLAISAGVVAFPADASDAEALISLAWEACHTALRLGGNTIYTPLISDNQPADEDSSEALSG